MYLNCIEINLLQLKKDIFENLKYLRKDEIDKKIESMKKIAEDYCSDMEELSDKLIEKYAISPEEYNRIQDTFDGDYKNNPCRENELVAELEKEADKVLAKYHFNDELEKEIGFKVMLDPDEHGTVVTYMDEALHITYYSTDNVKIELDSNLESAIMEAIDTG